MHIGHKSYLYLVNQDHSAWTWELDRAAFRFLLNGFIYLPHSMQSGLPMKNGKSIQSETIYTNKLLFMIVFQLLYFPECTGIEWNWLSIFIIGRAIIRQYGPLSSSTTPKIINF